MLGNDRMKIASTEVMSTRAQNVIEKFMWRTHRYFIDFESQIFVKISLPNRCHIFHVDPSFKIYEILTNFPCGISTSNRWRINEDMSIASSVLRQHFLQNRGSYFRTYFSHMGIKLQTFINFDI